MRTGTAGVLAFLGVRSSSKWLASTVYLARMSCSCSDAEFVGSLEVSQETSSGKAQFKECGPAVVVAVGHKHTRGFLGVYNIVRPVGVVV
jgi:hypothetical protein